MYDPEMDSAKRSRAVIALATLLAIACVAQAAADPPAASSLWERHSVPHGRVHVEHHRSRLLPVANREIYVYTPPGYAARGAKRYPVLYLLHGRGGVAADWTVAGLVNDIEDNLLAAGRATPMIIVMPWGHAIPEDAPRPADPARSNNELFERYLLQEVMPLVEGRYRIADDRRQRAIAGLSMGGGQSAQIGYRHTDLFASVGVFSAGLADDVTTRYPFLQDAAATNASMTLLFYGVGIEDERPHLALRRLTSALDARGVNNTYFETVGGHDWQVWRQCAAQLLPLLFPPQ
jgi:enterochelin esterase-like enzyme